MDENKIEEQNEDITNQTVVKKSYYDKEAHKIAQKKYREKNREKYREISRNSYHRNKENPEWKQKFNEACNKNSSTYYYKKIQKKMEEDPNFVPRKRGRPRKQT